MSINNLQLRIVRVGKDLGRGIYSAEEVFTQERIAVVLSGKQKMNFIQLPIESLIYVEIGYIDNRARGRYIHTFRDAMSNDLLTFLFEQKRVLDALFINRFGRDKLTVRTS